MNSYNHIYSSHYLLTPLPTLIIPLPTLLIPLPTLLTISSSHYLLPSLSQLNLLQLSQSNVSNLKTIVEDIERNETMFTPWFLENEPENLPVPVIEFRAGPNEEDVVNCINRLLVRRKEKG